MKTNTNIEISVVIPCLNESETLQICIDKIKKKFLEKNFNGEIIISDNGSTDGSLDIAKKNDVRIINVEKKGYGNAVIAGIQSSYGKYIFIADADNSYDFNELENFYYEIKKGYDIVQGCRFPSGGGKIAKDAMPISHKYIGNPFFSLLSRLFYNLPFKDVYCGMKIIRKSFFEKINFFSTGMVWCLEILIKSNLNGAKTSELPITLHKDGRVKGKSNLKTISDGLKTLKFLIVCSPKWIYFIPSIFLLLSPIILIFYSIILNNIYSFLNQNLLELASSFFLGSQLLMLGLYSTLRSETLGMVKIGQLNTFFRFFSLKLALSLSLILIFLLIYLYFFGSFYLLEDTNKKIFFIFSLLFFINIIINSFFISLLRINK